MSQCNKLKLQGIWTNNLQKGKEKQKVEGQFYKSKRGDD